MVKPDELNARGQLHTLLLAVLDYGPQDAHQVREAILRRSGGQFDLSIRIVTPALQRLEHLGLLSSSGLVIDGHHQRVYRLTPAGEGKLSTARAAWKTIAAAVTRVLDPRSLRCWGV